MQKEVNTDYLLWKRIKVGETKAFHELYIQYADILFSFGLIYTNKEELIKDCIHDLFFDLYKYRKNLANNDNIRNYLFKSLKRKIFSKPNRHTVLYMEDLPDKNKPEIPDIGEDGAEEEQIIMIRKIIRKLPDRQQEALNLRFQIGLSYPEVAKMMEISLESVRTLVYRSVKTIRKELKEKKMLILFLLETNFKILN